MNINLIPKSYFDDPCYKTEAYLSRLKAAQETELTRQALQRGEATDKTRAYARFLMACESAGSIEHGQRGKFGPPKNADLAREYPIFDGYTE